jgi:hypothetical protein
VTGTMYTETLEVSSSCNIELVPCGGFTVLHQMNTLGDFEGHCTLETCPSFADPKSVNRGALLSFP